MRKSEFGWHYLGSTLRDGSPIPPDFVWLPKLDNLIICERGYHGSKRPFDALQYAPGSLLTYCEYRGDFARQDDKFCASKRRILCRMDATEMLYYFARMQALSVLVNWIEEPADAVFKWLLSGEQRSAARAAAYSAADSVADSVAYSAADSAVRAAAYSAAYSVARAAAYSAADSVADSAARAAVRSAARNYFNELVYECFESVVNPDGSHK